MVSALQAQALDELARDILAPLLSGLCDALGVAAGSDHAMRIAEALADALQAGVTFGTNEVVAQLISQGVRIDLTPGDPAVGDSID